MPSVYIPTSDLLEALSDIDLREELISRGYLVSAKKSRDSTPTAPHPATGLDFDHVAHLAECGLVAEARTEALSVVGEFIGRRIH